MLGLCVTLITEEPYDRICHVRICGGAGRVTGWLYPDHTSGDPARADERASARDRGLPRWPEE